MSPIGRCINNQSHSFPTRMSCIMSSSRISSSSSSSSSCFQFFLIFFVPVPCARLSWPYRQLLSTRKYIVSYHIVSSLYLFHKIQRIREASKSTLNQTGCSVPGDTLQYRLEEGTSHRRTRQVTQLFTYLPTHKLFSSCVRRYLV